MMFKTVAISALVATAVATDCYSFKGGRRMGRRIGRAFCNDDVSNIDELPEAPVIPDFCSDRALNRCEDIFAAFVDDNCADKKDSFADSYDEYETYCEGTIDDSEEAAPVVEETETVVVEVAQQAPAETVYCTWGVDCPGSVTVCAPGTWGCDCPYGYDCSYPNNWDSYPTKPCYGYGCHNNNDDSNDYPQQPDYPCQGYGCGDVAPEVPVKPEVPEPEPEVPEPVVDEEPEPEEQPEPEEEEEVPAEEEVEETTEEEEEVPVEEQQPIDTVGDSD